MGPKRSDKTVGIIGGMGPEATAELMRQIIRATPAEDDCDHVRMIVDNDPEIPSRIKAIIEGGGEDPGPYLADMGKRLEQWGADFLAMPCNTAHYYYDVIQQAVAIPLLNMIELTADRISNETPEIKRLGVLASPAVFTTGILDRAFKRREIELLAPGKDEQEEVLVAIKRIKAGDCGEKVAGTLSVVCRKLVEKGAEALLIACTELSIIGDDLSAPVRHYDSCRILADDIVQKARKD